MNELLVTIVEAMLGILMLGSLLGTAAMLGVLVWIIVQIGL